MLKQDNQTPSDQVIHINGTTGTGNGDAQHPNRQEAVIIDAHKLASGSVIQLDNIEFAIVLGNVTLTGGNGSSLLIGDSGAQIIAGGRQNDTLIGGAGDDQFNAGSGNNLLDGSAGIDTLVDDSALANLAVVLTRNSNDSVNPFDQVIVHQDSGARTVIRNMERAQVEQVTYDLNFLQHSGTQLQNLGVLWQLLFNHAPGAQVIQDFASFADNTRDLIDKVLALPSSQALLSTLSDSQFAQQLVQNGLGSSDNAVQQAVASYLQQHSRSELLDVALLLYPRAGSCVRQ